MNNALENAIKNYWPEGNKRFVISSDGEKYFINSGRGHQVIAALSDLETEDMICNAESWYRCKAEMNSYHAHDSETACTKCAANHKWLDSADAWTMAYLEHTKG